MRRGIAAVAALACILAAAHDGGVRAQPQSPDPARVQTAYVHPAMAQLRGLDLERVRGGTQMVPPAAVGDLPSALTRVERARARKRLFMKTLLPAILKANRALRRQRDFVRAVAVLDMPRSTLPAEMRRRLARLEARYGVAPGQLGTLLRRVDIVPPGLALAQAAIESGWGTSRFAQEGNALFGERTYDLDASGMRPRGLDDADFKVRAFESVERAVRSYLHNLNTHPAYRAVRALRARARAAGRQPRAVVLARGLERYSERGRAYVEDVQVTIRANDFEDFTAARLRPDTDRLVDARPLTGAPR
jgi:Bax protein